MIDLEATFGHHMGEEEEAPVVSASVATDSPASSGPELDADGSPIIADDDDEAPSFPAVRRFQIVQFATCWARETEPSRAEKKPRERG